MEIKTNLTKCDGLKQKGQKMTFIQSERGFTYTKRTSNIKPNLLSTNLLKIIFCLN